MKIEFKYFPVQKDKEKYCKRLEEYETSNKEEAIVHAKSLKLSFINLYLFRDNKPSKWISDFDLDGNITDECMCGIVNYLMEQ